MESFLYVITQLGFVALTLIYLGLLLSAMKKALTKTEFTTAKQRRIFYGTMVGLGGWILFICIFSLTGISHDFSFPPKLMIVLILPFIVIVGLSFTKTINDIVKHIPIDTILDLQSFRFFVEILLWLLFIQHLLPVQMTFEGRNFDILVGFTGPMMAYLYRVNKLPISALALWNVSGLLLLINIVIIAIASMPTPLRVFMNEPANTIVAHFPIIWLPGVLIPMGYALHIFSFKQCLQTRKLPPIGR
jgi:hypothetical protein